MDRRKFVKNGALLGISSFFSSLVFPFGVGGFFKDDIIDISVVKGTDYFESTRKAVELIGGIDKFVPKGSTVGLLVNARPWWKLHGSHTNTDIVISCLKMCLDAGAKEIKYLANLSEDFWTRSELSKKYTKEIESIKMHSETYIEKQIPKGKSLKKAKMLKDLFECDVFINIPIAKHHKGSKLTATLKNLMGTSTRETNEFFHSGTGAEGSYDDVDHLCQCIADLNLIKKPDLCIVDATEFLITNGPAGPGELKRFDKVIAGTDVVGIDSYCATLLGLDPKENLMIKKAHQHKIGEIDLKKLKIKEVAI